MNRTSRTKFFSKTQVLHETMAFHILDFLGNKALRRKSILKIQQFGMHLTNKKIPQSVNHRF